MFSTILIGCALILVSPTSNYDTIQNLHLGPMYFPNCRVFSGVRWVPPNDRMGDLRIRHYTHFLGFGTLGDYLGADCVGCCKEVLGGPVGRIA
jgi:hypothetical protein